MKSFVKLYIRVRLPDASYPYLKPAYASNGRLRPHHAMHNGKAGHFVPVPAATFRIRWLLVSAMYTSPALSTATLEGWCNSALVAAPPSPL